jgi:hypothetical protein
MTAKSLPMKTFKRSLTLDELKAKCIENDLGIDTSGYERGSDFVVFQFQYGSTSFIVLYNTFNGNFIVTHRGKRYTEQFGADDKPWYAALLNFLYTNEDLPS